MNDTSSRYSKILQQLNCAVKGLLKRRLACRSGYDNMLRRMNTDLKHLFLSLLVCQGFTLKGSNARAERAIRALDGCEKPHYVD